MAVKKKSSSTDIASLPVTMTNLALASWETIARRTLLMSQNRCSEAEYLRMFSEKAEAAMKTGLTMMFSFGQAPMDVLMAPWLSKATANAKRLRKKR